MKLSGLIAAPFTPFHEEGSLNLSLIPSYAEHLAVNGVQGAFICGTTGEGSSMTSKERKHLAEAWKKHLPPDMKLIIHVGHLSLEESKALARHAKAIGADAIASIAPCFYKPGSAEDLINWCAGVSEAAPDMPFYYYHMPEMTGVDIPAIQFLKEGADRIPDLAGIKFTFEDLMDYTRALHFRDGRYDILFGRDEILLAGLCLGAQGAVGSTYNYAAPLFLEIMAAWAQQDLAKARATQLQAMEMIALLPAFGGLAAGKAIMKIIGLDCGPMRIPLRSLDENKLNALHRELQTRGILHRLPMAEIIST